MVHFSKSIDRRFLSTRDRELFLPLQMSNLITDDFS
jgi:hypothetical protein